MPGLVESGWELKDLKTSITTVDVGAAVGGGTVNLQIEDSRSSSRKLNYHAISGGAGVGVRTQGIARFVVNVIFPILKRVASAAELPARHSQIYLLEGLFDEPESLAWTDDFINKSTLMISVGAGAGVGLSGTLILFFPRRVAFGQLSPINAVHEARAIAFSGGMEVGQLGGDFLVTPCFQT